MKHTTLVIILVLIIAAVGGGAYLLSQKIPSTSLNNAQPTNQEQQTMMNKDDAARYVEYTKDVLEKSADQRRVLFFYANWCPICKPADESFRANMNKIPADVVLIRVNYNDSDTDAEEKALAQQYAITYQHTFVQIDAQGKEVTKWNGGDIDELLRNLR